MLNVDAINNGIVVDHIQAGTSLELYRLLELDKLENASIALIQNVRSNKSGKKDIIKIEGDVSALNLNILAYLDPGITVATIQDGKIVSKKRPDLPRKLVNVIRCRNPRCITSVEEECEHIFLLSSTGQYRCAYCEQAFEMKPE